MATGTNEKWDDFCGYVAAVTGRPVMKSKRAKNPQLNQAYCTVGILSTKQVEHDVTTITDTDPEDLNEPISESVRGMMLMDFVVSSFGGADFFNVLQKLRASFNSDIFIRFSAEKGFGLSTLQEVTDLSAVFADAQYENRAELKVSFYLSVPFDFVIDHYTWQEVTVATEEPEQLEMKFIVGEKPELDL